MSESIERVGVVGAGLMGAGIAEVAAKAGTDVTVCDINDAAVSAGRSRIETSLQRAVRAGKLDDDAAMAALARVRFVTDIGELADRQLVVEAVREFEDEKLEVFRSLGKIVIDDRAILASNTSSIPIMKLAVASERPEHVVGLHFFNPVPVMRLVELIPSIVTSAEVADRAEDFMVDGLGKRVIRSQDRAGFIVNALFVPYVLAAIRMLESGLRVGRRHRRRHGRGLLAPDGTAGTRRHDRPRHHRGGRRLDVRRVQGAPVRAAAVALAHGRGGAARPQGRPRVLQLHQVTGS